MEGKWRLEVHWSNGDFTAFPNLDGESIRYENDDNTMTFTFGDGVGEKKHRGVIFLNKINFLEWMKE